MAKQAVKKKAFAFGPNATKEEKLELLSKFKADNNFNDAKDKDLSWIVISPAFSEALKIPGIPKGYVSMVRGLQNTGKSTIKLQLMAACQRLGILPIIFETENNFNWDHARMCGVEFTDVMGDFVDEETGEVVQKVVDHDGFFIFMDSSKLFEKYGMNRYNDDQTCKQERTMACIEDVAAAINEFILMQKKGELPFELCFIWDSVGSLRSFRSLTSGKNNAMWDASAMELNFSPIMNDLIPSSRKENKEYTNTLFLVNKIWVNSMSMGAPQAMNKGGNAVSYGARLIIHLGGITSPGVEKLKATSGGATYYYGICTKIRIEKNQVNDVTYEGKICSLPHGLWSARKEALDEYKKKYAKYLMERLSELGANVDDSESIDFGAENENGENIEELSE